MTLCAGGHNERYCALIKDAGLFWAPKCAPSFAQLVRLRDGWLMGRVQHPTVQTDPDVKFCTYFRFFKTKVSLYCLERSFLALPQSDIAMGGAQLGCSVFFLKRQSAAIAIAGHEF